MSHDNLVGIALGIASLATAAVIFWGGSVEVKRAQRDYAERQAKDRGSRSSAA